MKCSQVGVTVIAIVNMLTWLHEGFPGIYVLPTGVTMYDFVKGRIDPMLKSVPFYRKNCAPEPDDASGARMKTIFRRRVKFAGSNVRNSFFEMPAGWYIVDEWDRCDRANLSYLEDRISRMDIKRRMKIGNPTFMKVGIHAEYLAGNQMVWLIRCGSCNHHQQLNWFENVVRQIGRRRYVLRDRIMQNRFNKLVIRNGPAVAARTLATQCEEASQDAKVYCTRCHRIIDRQAPGEWVPIHPDRPVPSRAINKMFADPTRAAIINVFRKQIESTHDPMLRQRWFNNDLGIPYEESGTRITDQLLDDAAADYDMPYKLPAQIMHRDFDFAVMGADVGTTMHVMISGIWIEHFDIHRLKLWIGQVESEQQIHDLIARYNVTSGVIDALPEQRMARMLCRRYKGFYMALYNKAEQKGDFIRDDKKRIISLNRTEALDASLAAWDAGLVQIPMNWRSIDAGQFAEQMKNPTRTFDSDKDRIIWTKGDDHYRHADTYDFYASRLPGATRWSGMKGQL